MVKAWGLGRGFEVCARVGEGRGWSSYTGVLRVAWADGGGCLRVFFLNLGLLGNWGSGFVTWTSGSIENYLFFLT